MIRILNNTFAAACYDDCSIADLEAALAGPADTIDCHEWDISPAEWREQIAMALSAKREYVA